MIDFKSDFVVLDTETTGLDKRAEIVELSIIDKHGNTLFDSLIKLKVAFPKMRNEYMAFQMLMWKMPTAGMMFMNV
jgi:DNA polymerase III epsilon subunit-like protein